MTGKDKSQLIDEMLAYLNNSIKELKMAQADYKRQADIAEGELVEPEDSSNQDQSIEMAEHYQQMIDSEEKNLNRMKMYKNIECKKIMPGAIVIAGDEMFFIGISIPKIKLKEGRSVMGVSTESDFYSSIFAKSTGDEIWKDNVKIKITDIL